jgi:hypothetical protein
MATDLFGKPIGGMRPEFKLNLQQKRQATLLYHWMSLDYLKGLKDLIDALIKGADVNIELAKRQGRDALLTNERWGVRDTSANWSTHVYPALEDFRKATIKDIALRATESYEFTGANQCGRMIDEFSSMWMTPEEEEAFKKQWDKVYSYASEIDSSAGAGGSRNRTERVMRSLWGEYAHLFPRLPKYRVRTDVEGESKRRPPRTGVYVPQDDVYGAMQFAWTGNEDGILGEVQTLNDLGLEVARALGREAMWTPSAAHLSIATSPRYVDLYRSTAIRMTDDLMTDINQAMTFVAREGFVKRPCKWYFVERVEGEFDDDEGRPESQAAGSSASLRAMAGETCPREGWWVAVVKADSRRHFKAGEVMPDLKSDAGVTIWQWDTKQ